MRSCIHGNIILACGYSLKTFRRRRQAFEPAVRPNAPALQARGALLDPGGYDSPKIGVEKIFLGCINCVNRIFLTILCFFDSLVQFRNLENLQVSLVQMDLERRLLRTCVTLRAG